MKKAFKWSLVTLALSVSMFGFFIQIQTDQFAADDQPGWAVANDDQPGWAAINDDQPGW